MESQNFSSTQVAMEADNNANSSREFHIKSPTDAEIQGWLISSLVELLEIDTDAIDVTIPFYRYGLDSSAMIGLTGDLENWLGYELDPTVMYHYPSIEALAQHLAEKLKSRRL